MNAEEMISCAKKEGFASACVVETGEIVFDPSFRPYCEENLCGQYGVNYSCPPACGTPEEMKQKILAYDHALVLQSLWDISDYTDKAAIKNSKNGHNRASLKLMEQLRKEGYEGFLVGASGCALCSPCAIVEKEPCRFPDLGYSCMSAYCIYVKKLAERCQMMYDCTEGKLSFFGMFVFR